MGAKVKVPVVVLLIIFGLIQFFTGLILYFMPHGKHFGKIEFFEIQRSDWSYWHTWIGFTLVFLVLVHFILNWKYFLGELRVFRKRGF